MTEGDLLAVFSQYGEIEDVKIVRPKKRKDENYKSKEKVEKKFQQNPLPFAFIKYEDSRSCVLAVDNFNETTIAGQWNLKVDHVREYRRFSKKRIDGKLVDEIDEREVELEKRRIDAIKRGEGLSREHIDSLLIKDSHPAETKVQFDEYGLIIDSSIPVTKSNEEEEQDPMKWYLESNQAEDDIEKPRKKRKKRRKKD